MPTTRKYKFMGAPYAGSTIDGLDMTVSINNQVIHNGPVVGQPWKYAICVSEGQITFTQEPDIKIQYTMLPVSITVNSGTFYSLVWEWDYAWIVNPLLSPEELVVYNQGDQAMANAPQAMKDDVAAKGGWVVQDVNSYATTNLDNDPNTRFGVMVNGEPFDFDYGTEPIDYEDQGRGILLSAGYVCTYSQRIFRSPNN